MTAFLAKVATILEVASVTPETDFRQVPGWCSLKAFGLLVMLEEDHGQRLSVDDFLKLRTVADLAAVAKIEEGA